jgi:hypothetical protein
MANLRPGPPRPAFYALSAGGWRDYVTLLHLPYTAWHLSYVVMGAALAPVVRVDRLFLSVLAFFLALGVAAHALDELNGRPLQTRIPKPVLVTAAAVALTAAVAIGLYGVLTVHWSIALFIIAGALLVVVYNLELWEGHFHNDWWFAAAWGVFPVATAYWAMALQLSPAALLLCLHLRHEPGAAQTEYPGSPAAAKKPPGGGRRRIEGRDHPDPQRPRTDVGARTSLAGPDGGEYPARPHVPGAAPLGGRRPMP